MSDLSVGARLREERERVGMTQEQFAVACGVRRRAQCSYERGDRYPDARYLEAAANVLGVNVSYVIEKQGEPTSPQHNAAQLRLLDVIRALAGHEVFGRRLTDLAADVGNPEPMVLRDLQALASKGWATQDASRLWRLGPEPVQIAVQFSIGLRAAQAKVSEVEQRYTRLPG